MAELIQRVLVLVQDDRQAAHLHKHDEHRGNHKNVAPRALEHHVHSKGQSDTRRPHRRVDRAVGVIVLPCDLGAVQYTRAVADIEKAALDVQSQRNAEHQTAQKLMDTALRERENTCHQRKAQQRNDGNGQQQRAKAEPHLVVTVNVERQRSVDEQSHSEETRDHRAEGEAVFDG